MKSFSIVVSQPALKNLVNLMVYSNKISVKTLLEETPTKLVPLPFRPDFPSFPPNGNINLSAIAVKEARVCLTIGEDDPPYWP